MEMTFEDLQKEHDSLEYPPNCKFNVETLEPIGASKARVDKLKSLLLTGYSLLDVGCNKGLVSFFLRDEYKYIEAIDCNIEFIQFANKLVGKHKIKHINFLQYSFEDFINEGKFDTVYFGQCTHYIFRNAVRKRVYPLSFLHKAKRLSKNVIAIDGAFTIEDPSVKFDSKQDNWTDEIKKLVTIQAHCEELWPEFELSSFYWSGNGATRSLALFKRRADV